MQNNELLPMGRQQREAVRMCKATVRHLWRRKRNGPSDGEYTAMHKKCLGHLSHRVNAKHVAAQLVSIQAQLEGAALDQVLQVCVIIGHR